MGRLKPILKATGFAIVGLWLGLIVLGQWVLSPYPGLVIALPQDGLAILRTVQAERVVIGDSRVAVIPSNDRVHFIGYNGATTDHMVRLVGTVCALSDVPVVLALGVNDTVFRIGQIDRSLATLEQMGQDCAPAQVTLVQAWPGEPGKPPLGDASDAESLAQINAGIAELARRHGWGLVRVPELGPDHTYDGIHFMPPVQQRYVDLLSGEAGSEGLGGVSARR